MTCTPFVDSLMMDNFDSFKAIINDFKNIKAKLYNENRRVKKPICTYTAYEGLKGITADIQAVWNGRRIKDDRALELFKAAIRKINLLVRELRYFERTQLANSLEELLGRVTNLLPSNTAIQLELFAVEQFETGSKERPTHPSFRHWQWEALHRQRQRIREAMFNPVQTALVQFVQMNIKFSGASR